MKLKEPLAGSLHLFGMLLSIAALVLLLVFGHDSAWKIVSFSLYGASLILLYLFSTLYHWLPQKAGGKYQVFRKFDHLFIYILIAGTYTPFCLVVLNGPWGWTLFGIIWSLATVSVILQAIYINVWRWLTTLIYIAMGWLIVVAIVPLVQKLPAMGLFWLVLGGVIYSLGGVVYTIRKPDLFKHFGYHELWHTLVLLGSACHFVVIFFYIALK
jgi:hemolysin III